MRYLLIILNLFSFLYPDNPIDNYLLGNNNLIVVGDFDDGIDKPRDLDFHPTIDNQLWVLNQGEDIYINNSENIYSLCIPEN